MKKDKYEGMGQAEIVYNVLFGNKEENKKEGAENEEAKIIENTTGLNASIFEKHGMRRVYINAKQGHLAHNIYFDADKFDAGNHAMFFKGNNYKVDKRAWSVEKSGDNYKIISNKGYIDEAHIIVKF